jgi:hypothetical protein
LTFYGKGGPVSVSVHAPEGQCQGTIDDNGGAATTGTVRAAASATHSISTAVTLLFISCYYSLLTFFILIILTYYLPTAVISVLALIYYVALAGNPSLSLWISCQVIISLSYNTLDILTLQSRDRTRPDFQTLDTMV